MPRHAAYTLAWCQDEQTYEVSAKREHAVPDLVPESQAWVAWLQSLSSFAFHGQTGSYTARKERQSQGQGYWYAYARLGGKVTKRYLGPSTGLTLARLEQVAQELGGSQHPDGPHDEDVHAWRPVPSPSIAAPAPAGAMERTFPATAQPPTAPLLATKVHAPRPRSVLVQRTRLTERLQQGMEGHLTLLSAPAGFGKTTLLSSWLTESGTDVAWFSVEPEDNDPVRFFSYLIAALRTLDAHIGGSVLPLLQSPQQVMLETALTLLINDLSHYEGLHVALVLDDYHVITAESLHRALIFLVEHLPPQLHLILATRVDPPLPLARWRARGQLTELRTADLRFTPEEAHAFLHMVMGLDLPPEAIATLERRTEGWIAGLQLAALSLQGGTDVSAFLSSFTGSHRFVLTYLSEEVLWRQPAPVQSFLLHTCILERLYNGPRNLDRERARNKIY